MSQGDLHPAIRANAAIAELWGHSGSGAFTALHAYVKARIEELTEQVLSMNPSVPRELNVARIDELRRLLSKPQPRLNAPGDQRGY